MKQAMILQPLVKWWSRLRTKPQPVSQQRPPVARVIDKPLLNPRIPNDVIQKVGNACVSGKWLIAVWRIEDGKVFLDRTAMNFPSADVDQAMRMIVEDVQQLKVK